MSLISRGKRFRVKRKNVNKTEEKITELLESMQGIMDISMNELRFGLDKIDEVESLSHEL